MNLHMSFSIIKMCLCTTSKAAGKARSIKETLVWDIHEQCKQAGVAFFFKQWGGVNKKKSGRELGGRTYNEMPLLSF